MDYVSSSALTGLFKDEKGHVSPLTLPSPGTEGSLSKNKNIIVDGTIPTIVKVSSPHADGNYSKGDILNITVEFSEEVSVVC